MNEMLKIVGVTLVVAILIGIFMHYEISIWSECLGNHGLYYCIRVLG